MDWRDGDLPSDFDRTVVKNLNMLERLIMRRVQTKTEARVIIARMTKIQPGTLENIRRSRTKGVRAYVAEAIYQAVLNELSGEIKRLEHERFIIEQQTGCHSQETSAANAHLDASFFRVRFERLSLDEKQYFRGMAEIGAGTHRSSDIADRLGKDLAAVEPIRESLIAKGMLYSPSDGDTAFTEGLFDSFMNTLRSKT